MSFVLVVDQERRPLAPVHPGHARWLLTHGKAAVLRRMPFTLLLKCTCPQEDPLPLRLKLDPGSRTTGLAVVNDGTGQVVWAAERTHRGEQVKHALEQRRGCDGADASGTRGIANRGFATADGNPGGSPRPGSAECTTW